MITRLKSMQSFFGDAEDPLGSWVAQSYYHCTNNEWKSQLIVVSVMRMPDVRECYILNGVYIHLGSPKLTIQLSKRVLFGDHCTTLCKAWRAWHLACTPESVLCPRKNILYYSFTFISPLWLKWEEGGIMRHFIY